MILFLHGAAGGWDELLIAVAAFGVLWIAVKLAGRKPIEAGEEEAAPGEVAAEVEQEHEGSAQPRASKPG